MITNNNISKLETMANVVITSTENSVSINLGQYAKQSDPIQSGMKKTSLEKVDLFSNCVELYIKNSKSLILHFESNEIGAFIVDSIDDVAPESLQDLYDKLFIFIE